MSGMELQPPASPCTGICRLDPADGLCQGCLRTMEEIAGWSRLTPAAQWDLLFALERRRASRRRLPLRPEKR